jgi:hypothetical protein
MPLAWFFYPDEDAIDRSCATVKGSTADRLKKSVGDFLLLVMISWIAKAK